MVAEVTRLGPAEGPIAHHLARSLAARGLRLVLLAPEAPIPGSYWGEPEAGLIGDSVLARPDTPLASLLHEICHWLCMDDARRTVLHTNAGGDELEECAVCYLSVLMAADVPQYSAAQMLGDMDRWGYSFRLGSAARWFAEDADDARGWLVARGLLDQGGSAAASIPSSASTKVPASNT